MKLRKPAAAAVAAIVLCVSAFGGRETAAAELTEVSYRLKWLFNISVVGDLYADAHGFFAGEGLRVDIKPGGPERDAIKELELNRAQFGVASADQVIRAASKGSPIVVLCQLFQTNPLHWIYRPDRTPFESPSDFEGRTVGITFGGNDEAIMRALLARYQLKESQLSLYSVRYDYTPFYQGQVDFWPLYLNAQAPIIGGRLEKAGEAFAFVNPAEFGIRFVANSVITSRRMLAEHPDTVRRFTRALVGGWRAALDPANAERAVKVVLRFNRETPEEIVRRQLPVTRDLMLPARGAGGFGTIDTPAWRQTEAIMLQQKLIPEPVNVAELLIPILH
jgi:NitT/TauT family transport system substrate-binding protein